MVSVRKIDPPLNPEEISYPEEDDEPLAETQLTGEEMVRITETLQIRYAGDPDVYVWMNIFVYYEEYVADAVFAPDVLVAFGVPKLPRRRTYKVWEEGAPPTVVFEVTSQHTRDRDIYLKWNLDASIGVQEYILYDPHDHYLSPPLQGFHLVNGRYQPFTQETGGALLSDALGLRLALVDGRLRLFDRETDEEQRSPAELLVIEQQARAAVDTRVAELEARLRALGGDTSGG